MKWLFLFVLTIGASLNTYSQVQITKTVILDQVQTIGKDESLVIAADTLIFGHNADLYIEGVLEIQSPYILLDPGAQMKGFGTIRIVSPSLMKDARFTENTPTVVNGNGNLNIKVDIELSNQANLLLDKLKHPFIKGEDLRPGIFVVNSKFSLMDDGVCIELRGNRFTLGLNGVLDNASPRRMVISNGNINSLFSKNMHANSVFEFPIGLVEGDYSPVIAKPEKNVELFVSVMKHSLENGVLSFVKKEGGIDRIWGVHADNSVRTTYTFEHNEKDESGLLKSSGMEIFQYSDAHEWRLTTTNYLENRRHSTKNLANMFTNAPVNYFSKFGIKRATPQSKDDRVTMKEGQSIVIPVLSNDKEGDGKFVMENAKIVEGALNGFAEFLPSGEVRYKPVNKFIGSDSLIYEVVDEFGLTSRSTVFITVDGEGFNEGLFVMSNVLTPNGDGYNDQLIFVNQGEILQLELTIVNRWGDRLYESKAYNNTWDGVGLSGGTYYYIIKGRQQDGNIIHQKGWILLNK
ncbi:MULTISPECIES: gliding motility-associated C-terminal domain-containing protein [Sphingobacterium]|uniref:T9SS type B sorting domain-containing protein n=1 Tax=Sphingobacterium TaxID=28453 RepID=UPI0013DD1A10|nr:MULTISPECIES: gliding motility-associated C-terminal domain-containing protein [unclassified Sphingobacterium]